MSCLAIATAFHEGKFYHRDLSTKSVTMTEGQGGIVQGVLSDWNFAKRVGAESTEYKLRPVCQFLGYPFSLADSIGILDKLATRICLNALQSYQSTRHHG